MDEETRYYNTIAARRDHHYRIMCALIINKGEELDLTSYNKEETLEKLFNETGALYECLELYLDIREEVSYEEHKQLEAG